MQYLFVEAAKAKELEAKVNEAIKQDWESSGGVSVDTVLGFHQAMIWKLDSGQDS